MARVGNRFLLLFSIAVNTASGLVKIKETVAIEMCVDNFYFFLPNVCNLFQISHSNCRFGQRIDALPLALFLKA